MQARKQTTRSDVKGVKPLPFTSLREVRSTTTQSKKRFLPFTFHHSSSPAFTLSEILVTLGIIGILAAMTIPTLINSIVANSQQTHAKKMYSTISQAVELAKQDNGNSYNGLLPDDIIAKLSVAKKCNNAQADGCSATSYKSYTGTAAPTSWSKRTSPAVILASGEAVIFGEFTSDCSIIGESQVSTYCGLIQFDLNGPTKPNTFGKDYFSIFLFPGSIGIKPAGHPRYDGYWADHAISDCNQANNTAWSGWGCMAKVLMGQSY